MLISFWQLILYQISLILVLRFCSIHAMMIVRRDDILGATSPPPGVTPNFVNPVSRAHIVIVVNVACTVVSVSFVGLRSYTAFCITRRPRRDDCTSRPYERKENVTILLIFGFLRYVDWRLGMVTLALFRLALSKKRKRKRSLWLMRYRLFSFSLFSSPSSSA